MDRPKNPMSAHRVLPNPAFSQQLVEDFCSFADVPTRELFTTCEVLELLAGVGYAVDAGVLQEFTRKGYITLPPRERWNATEIHRLAFALDARHRWQVGHKLHREKKSAAELEAERDPGTFLTEASRWSLEDLLLAIVSEDCRETREVLLVTIKAKLALLKWQE